MQNSRFQETITKHPESVGRSFFNACSMRVLFTLLQTTRDSTRILLLKLLHSFLLFPDHHEQFRRENGFYLLGFHLGVHPITQNSMGTLFSIMFGRRVSSQASEKVEEETLILPDFSIQNYFRACPNIQEMRLAYPEAVISILLATTNELLDGQTKHSVLKILHDVFLQV